MSSLQGTCLCGAVRFTVHSRPTGGRYCHCVNCRKFSGAAHGAWAMVDEADFALTHGEALVREYDSGHGLRCFCTKCGSPVCFRSKDYPIIGIPLGVLDERDADLAPEKHIWMQSNPAWHTVSDTLPQLSRNE